MNENYDVNCNIRTLKKLKKQNFISYSKFKYVQNQPKMTIADLYNNLPFIDVLWIILHLQQMPGRNSYILIKSQSPQIKQVSQGFFGMIKNTPLSNFIKQLMQ